MTRPMGLLEPKIMAGSVRSVPRLSRELLVLLMPRKYDGGVSSACQYTFSTDYDVRNM